MLFSRGKWLQWPVVALFGAVSAALMVAAPRPASAGIFDFLFGVQQQAAPPPDVTSYAEPSAPLARLPTDLGAVQPGSGSGRFVAFCVRLCDGQHFPLDHMTNATPVETCRAMCPASKTKIFFGSDIDRAVAGDGARYADLDNAFVYRQRLVPHCTCNGKDAFGLAKFDLTSDPTLRPGDIVVNQERLQGLRRQTRTDRRLHAGRSCGDQCGIERRILARAGGTAQQRAAVCRRGAKRHSGAAGRACRRAGALRRRGSRRPPPPATAKRSAPAIQYRTD